MITPFLFNSTEDARYNRSLMFLKGDKFYYMGHYNKEFISAGIYLLYPSDILRLKKRE